LKRNADQSKLWIKHDRRLVLHGVIVEDEIIRNEPHKTISLGAEWQKTFDEKPFNLDEARTFWEQAGDIGSYDTPPPPDIWNYFRVTNTHKNTAPGPDAFPYSAWKHRHSAMALQEADQELRLGHPAPTGFNDSCCKFSPKEDNSQDGRETLREAAKTRPLSLKNCDNKMIMEANMKACEPQFRNIAHVSQNGFVRGRNFLHNIVDIDAAGRIYSTKYVGGNEQIHNLVKNIPVIAPFDFSAAFPSIFQAWVWLVLEHRKLPQCFITLLKALYTDAKAIFVFNGTKHIIIRFKSGVLQGCPASGWLFDSGLDPFLVYFSTILENGRKGIVRACADDLSFALSRLKHLILLYPIYSAAAKHAGLTVHPKKSTIIPLIKKDDYRYEQIRKWINKNIPSWSQLQVEDAAKVLGFYVGPGSGRLNWTGPLEKLTNRVRDIKSATASIHINAYDYNVRVCPVLSYQAQLLPLDERHFMLERIALHTVLRAPWNTFRHSDFFKLHKFGGPKLRSFNIACASALFRTAARTVHNWGHWISQMSAAADEHLPVSRSIQGFHYPDFWDSPSFAHNLFWAFEGFVTQKKFMKAGVSLVQQITEQNNGERPLPGGEFFLNFRALQKSAYSVICKEVFPDEPHTQLDILCVNRCENLFAPFDIFAEDGANFGDAFSLLETVGGHIGLKVMKSWLNGWATSHRMHEDPMLVCILGCSHAPDSLNHYVFCPHLFAFQRYLFDDISEDPLIRFGIKSPGIFSFKVISCLFSAYHALKSEIRAGKINMHANSWLKHAWSVFANACKAEAGELHLSTRAFSLTKFIDFLMTGRVSHPAINSHAHDDPH